jgi:hypothetical protein
MASVSIAVQEKLELDRLRIRLEIDQVKFSQTITNTYNLRSSGFAKQVGALHIEGYKNHGFNVTSQNLPWPG